MCDRLLLGRLRADRHFRETMSKTASIFAEESHSGNPIGSELNIKKQVFGVLGHVPIVSTDYMTTDFEHWEGRKGDRGKEERRKVCTACVMNTLGVFTK